MIYSLRINVKGKVQGVWFRKSTQLKASALGLCGDVQNLKDGSVLIQVTGEKENVLGLLKWCENGSLHSKVDSISYEEIESIPKTGFEIIR